MAEGTAGMLEGAITLGVVVLMVGFLFWYLVPRLRKDEEKRREKFVSARDEWIEEHFGRKKGYEKRNSLGFSSVVGRENERR